MAPSKGLTVPDNDDPSKKMQNEALESYEAFLENRERYNPKSLCIDAYERILLDRRASEADLLNLRRVEEIEKNRPPEQGWFMSKDKSFWKEVYRNVVDLKPRNKNKEYLTKLRDKSVY